jgi:hypothetical protein
MTILERINLHKCGYTKEEIAALAEEEKQNPVPTETAEPTEPAADPTSAPAAEPTTNNAEILKAIKDLTAAIQTRNINNSQQEPPKVETAEDVLTGALKNL